jgi:hypothetical protein
MIWLGLPVTNAISTEDVLDVVADFDLSSVAEETIGGSGMADVVFKGVDQLFVCLHSIDVASERFHTTVELCTDAAGVDGRGVRVGCDGFVSAMYIEGWKRRSVLPFHVRTHREGGVLSHIF